MARAADRPTGGDRLLDLTALPLANLLAFAGGSSPIATQLRDLLDEDRNVLRAFSSRLKKGRAHRSRAGETG